MPKKLKITPGPWTVTLMDNYYGGYHVAEAEARQIDGEGDDESRAEDEANARLIAAAPELLEALKSVVGYCDNSDVCDRFGEMYELITDARAAISKAEPSVW